MNAAAKFIEDQIEEVLMETRAEKIEAHVDHIEQIVTNITLDVRQLQGSLKSANDSVNELKGDVRVINATIPHLASKEDLRNVEAALGRQVSAVDERVTDEAGKLRTEISRVEGELKTEIKGLEGKLSKEIESLDGKLSKEIKSVEGELRTEIKSVEGKLSTQMRSMEVRVITWFVGTLIALATAFAKFVLPVLALNSGPPVATAVTVASPSSATAAPVPSQTSTNPDQPAASRQATPGT